MFDDAVNVLKEYISMENIFFVPLLIFIGRVIKSSKRFDDSTIPEILGVLGVFLCSLVALKNNQPVTWIDWTLLVCVAIGQGVSVAGVAVFVNQWAKQHDKYKLASGFDGDSKHKNGRKKDV